MVRPSSAQVSSLAEDYSILQKGVGLCRPSLSLLCFQGPDRKDFLQGASSNDLRHLKPDQGLATLHLTPKGKWIAALKVFEKDEALWALTSPSEAQALHEGMKTLLMFSQTQLKDLSKDYFFLQIVGEMAPAFAAKVFQMRPEAPALWHHPVTLEGILVDVLRDFDQIFPVFFLIAPRAEEKRIWNALLSVPQDFPVKEIGAATLELIRLEAGIPAYGIDVDEKTIPPEANLDEDYISYTKGCYVGQEIIARLKHYGRVQRRLARLQVKALMTLPNPTPLFYEGKEVGTITSSSFSPRLEAVVALAFLPRDLAEKGKVLKVAVSSGEIEATVM